MSPPYDIAATRVHEVAVKAHWMRGARRTQTPREEVLNALSHGLGLILALASLPILVFVTARQGSVATVVGAVLYGATMVVLYFTSTVHRAPAHGQWTHRFNRTDHASIYLFIAGSYMPFALGSFLDPWGWTLFGVVWGIAAAGTLAKLLHRWRHRFWSTGLYVAVEGLVLVAVQPMLKHIGPEGLALLVAGGVAYTVEVIFFVLDAQYRYAYFIWHLFVLSGCALHFAATLLHAMARGQGA